MYKILNYAKGLTNTVLVLLVRSLPYHNTDCYFIYLLYFLCIMIWENKTIYLSIYL